ncbi:MAG: flavodoxin family protein [Bacteroidales bacterium]|nr:flavodoxin family protein [Bacteroidales bacterium]
MKKIMIIDGSPRKNMNTAAMVAAFVEGVREGGGEAKVVRLYDLDYKGCRSCMACQLKGPRANSCRFPDGLTETLKECTEADGLVIASPIYYGEVTAMTRAFWERLTYPWLNYSTAIFKAPMSIPVTFIYTMNGMPSNGEKVRRSSMRSVETMTSVALGHKVEVLMANNTTQVNDYSRYEFPESIIESKKQWRDAHWEEDLAKAREAGKQMVTVGQ